MEGWRPVLKHLALVEDDMFSVKLHGRPPHPPWDTVDWDADPDWEWRTAAEDSRISSRRSGRRPWTDPAPWPPRPSPTAVWAGSPPTPRQAAPTFITIMGFRSP
jgi:hypothetical protein